MALEHHRLCFAGETFRGGDPRVAILSVPYDGTTSYQSGTRKGPDSILHASINMELYDEVLDADPSRLGLLTLAPVSVSAEGPRRMLDDVRAAVDEVVGRDLFPVVLGGEHSITAGVIEALEPRWDGLPVLHLDAHADMRDSYEGSRWSHACVMRRVRERCPAISLGIRSLSEEEARFAETHRLTLTSVRETRRPEFDLATVLSELGPHVYVSIDVDVLDPSIMPSTGTPEPEGFTWAELDTIIQWVAENRRIVGFDVMELMPIPGFLAPDYLAARMTYRTIGRSLLRATDSPGPDNRIAAQGKESGNDRV